MITNDTFNRLDITQDGSVFLSKGGYMGVEGNGWLSLSGVSYKI